MKIHRITARFKHLGLDPVGTWLYRIFKDTQNKYKLNLGIVPKLNFVISNFNSETYPVFMSNYPNKLGCFYINYNRGISRDKIISYI